MDQEILNNRLPNRLPSWLKRKKDVHELRTLKLKLRASSLSTVCEEARCPNITECFSRPTATFLILGDICTRACKFCSIKKGTPHDPDQDEPVKIARAAMQLGLNHIVITSVTRDDLKDKGAMAFAQTISEIRKHIPNATIEVLTPDFSGDKDLLKLALKAKPTVYNHNVETVRRLHDIIRPQADLDRSLSILKWAHELSDGIIIKSGFMVGMGETEDEISELLHSLKLSGCDMVTIGQYMQPTKEQIPVQKYWPPNYFKKWSDLAKSIGIRYVVSGPLVRSSYHAKEALEGTCITAALKH